MFHAAAFLTDEVRMVFEIARVDGFLAAAKRMQITTCCILFKESIYCGDANLGIFDLDFSGELFCGEEVGKLA